MARIWRQGDVVVSEISEIPGGALPLKTNEIRIASETGNPHVMKARQLFVVENQVTPAGAFEQYAMLDQETIMTHPEHASLALPPGIYRVSTVRDYAPPRRLLD